jgi:hypothetical protein
MDQTEDIDESPRFTAFVERLVEVNESIAPGLTPSSRQTGLSVNCLGQPGRQVSGKSGGRQLAETKSDLGSGMSLAM